VEYIYDALGRRVGKRVINGETAQDHYRSIPSTGGEAGLQSTTAWRYDGQHIAYEETRDAAGSIIDDRWYSHSDYTDDIIAVTSPTGASGTSSPTALVAGPDAPSDASLYYHSDHQGSVRALTDDAGAIINEYSYTSYGDEEVVVAGFVQPFRYTGREHEEETGLYYYRARHFDANTGRFLQEDPIWFEALRPNIESFALFDDEFPEGEKKQTSLATISASELNIYRYTTNNPVNFIDPNGTVSFGTTGLLLRIAIIYPVAKKALKIGFRKAAERAKYEVAKNADNISKGVTCAQAFNAGWDLSPPKDGESKFGLKTGCFWAGAIAGGVARWFGG